jgi:hypothetical protein
LHAYPRNQKGKGGPKSNDSKKSLALFPFIVLWSAPFQTEAISFCFDILFLNFLPFHAAPFC